MNEIRDFYLRFTAKRQQEQEDLPEIKRKLNIWTTVKPKNKMKKDIEIMDYKRNSVVVHGIGTKRHSETLREMGGLWNARLTHPKTNVRLMGWIFKKKDSDQMEAWVRENALPIQENNGGDAICPDPGELAQDQWNQNNS